MPMDLSGLPRQGAPLYQMQPSQYIPDAFPAAQALRQHIAGPLANMMLKAVGGPFSRGINLSNYGIGSTYVHPEGDTQEANVTAAHEAGHTIFDSMTDAQRQSWRAVHAADPLMAGAGYKRDPDHAFSEAYGMYAATPLKFQRESPAAYNFIRDLAGFEYAGGDPTARAWAARTAKAVR